MKNTTPRQSSTAQRVNLAQDSFSDAPGPQIPRQMAEVQAALERLTKASAQLVERIRAVSSDATEPKEVDSSEAKREPLVPLAETFQNYASHITSVARMLENAADRVQL